MARDKTRYNEYMRDYMLRRYHERRARTLHELGGKCSKCGSTLDLELDHADAAKKSFDISKIWSYSDGRFETELAKCQLLCGRCHHRKHASLFPCGTAQRYWRGCRCDPCTKANTAHSRAYKQGRMR